MASSGRSISWAKSVSSANGRHLPDLADDVRLGVGRVDRPAELGPERAVVDLVGHVEPPAVGAEVDPVAADVPEELADGRGVGVELGQGVQAPPGVVARGLVVVIGVHRPAVDGEPVEVGRVLAVLQDVVELEESPARVVEHAVEDDLDPPGVGPVDQPAERRVAAEHRVDPVVIVGVVAVVGGRLEDRREVDRVDAEVGQVVEVFQDAEQVAPLVAVGVGGSPQASRWAGLGTRQAAREAVGEDLVEDRVADPVGRLGSVTVASGLNRRMASHGTRRTWPAASLRP